MKAEINITENYYKLENSTYYKINEIINRYFYDLNKNINENNILNELEIPSNLLAIAEGYEFFLNKEKWLENTFILMEKIKSSIEKGEYNHNLCFFEGLSEVVYAVNILSEKTGHYKKFIESLNYLFTVLVKYYISYCRNNIKNLMITHYDAVLGLSGIGYCLLITDNKNKKELLYPILEYLVELTDYYEFNGYKVPVWHIKSENQIRKDEKVDFPLGNLNFGLAHGILGPLVLLSKSYNKNIIVDNQLLAIERIIKIYKEFATSYDNVYHWPTQLKFEEYVKNKSSNNYRTRKASWCYGNSGISRALYISSKCINDKSMEEFAINNLKNISLQNDEDYILHTPIICHGYAGLLCILNQCYRDTMEQEFKIGTIKILNKIIDSYEENSKFGFVNREYISMNDETILKKSENNGFLEGTSGIVLALMSVLKTDSYFETHLLIK